MAVRLAATLLAAAAPALAGCVSIDGGSVEVPWAIFDNEGRAITQCGCTEPALAAVRLDLVSEADGSTPCAGQASCQFPCADKRGATPFFVPPGAYRIALVPLGADGTDLSIASPSVATPFGVTLPIVQPVVRGQPTELMAFAFTAPCQTRCGGDDPTRACSSE